VLLGFDAAASFCGPAMKKNSADMFRLTLKTGEETQDHLIS
jgi:hypothetical protein